MILEFLNFIFSKVLFFCGAITGECFPKPLSPEEEEKYLKLFKENGDINAKNQLIEHNLRLVAHIVKKYQGAENTDDLISTGTIGLIKAVNTYDIEKGAGLATYTARCIENEILMLLRSNKKYSGTVSLSDSVGKDKDGNDLTLIDLLCDENENVYEKVERKMERKAFIKLTQKCLNEREYLIISLRYGLKNGNPLPQREVANFLKISRSYVSRIEKRAIQKLREEIKKSKVYFD